MRQGRFRPQEDRALETLIEIGKTEAGLGREWACRLLSSGRHPTPESVLQRIFPVPETAQTACPQVGTYHLPRFGLRLAGGFTGLLLTLIFWSYGINRVYPAPHELLLWLEALWGVLVGTGLAIGIVVGDAIQERTRPWWLLREACHRYLMLPASGLIGGLLWNGLLSRFFPPQSETNLASSWQETFTYGAVYGLAFALGMLLACRGVPERPLGHPWMPALFIPIFLGGFSLLGFLLAVIHPSFTNQKDVDIFVGIFFRVGLLLAVSAFFPPLSHSVRNLNLVGCLSSPRRKS
jgi:hypothetical protein